MNRITALALGFSLVLPFGCEKHESKEKAADQVSGDVSIDGSSTVAPISTAAAEMFREVQPDVRVTVGTSGTGGGFKKFHDPNPDLRTDIAEASRPIHPSEIEKCQKAGVEFIEIPIAMDGIAVVVNPKNTTCNHLTVAELKRIWEPESKITNWKDVRQGFPDMPLKLYGPGTDSGTFDYFTQVVVEKEKASRSDYNASEDDNVLVQGVSGDAGGLGYFGFSYYEANRAKLKLLAIDNGDRNPIEPTLESIRTGAYKPLTRPLFLYVNKASAQRPAVAAFLEFYLTHAKDIVQHPSVGYVALSDELYQADRRRLKEGITGSAIASAGGKHDVKLEELYVRK